MFEAERALKRGGGLQRLGLSIMIPDPGALTRRCTELPIPVAEVGVGGVIARAVDASAPLDTCAALVPQCLGRLARHVARMPGQRA